MRWVAGRPEAAFNDLAAGSQDRGVAEPWACEMRSSRLRPARHPSRELTVAFADLFRKLPLRVKCPGGQRGPTGGRTDRRVSARRSSGLAAGVPVSHILLPRRDRKRDENCGRSYVERAAAAMAVAGPAGSDMSCQSHQLGSGQYLRCRNCRSAARTNTSM